MALALTAAAPALVDDTGGAAVTLTGTFEVGQAYRVYVGTDATGQVCYSGVSGFGALCYPRSRTTLTLRLPTVAPGSVTLTVQNAQDGTLATLRDAVRAEAPFLYAQVFALRQNVRPILATGATDPAQMPDPTPVPGFAP